MTELLNTCFATTNYYHTIAYYSHLVPTFLALFLSIYTLFKTRFTKLSVIFFLFTFSFSLWLIGDLVLWTSSNYHAVYFFWSWLDYVNVIFFIFGAYFFGVLARGEIAKWEKLIFILICVPIFLLTISGNSVIEFNQPVCEAAESGSITLYKLLAEALTVASILFSLVLAWKKSNKKKKKELSLIALAVLLFFGVFSSTEYIATITDVYETSLYGLFVLPVFLIIMVFSITNLRVFQIRFLGTQLLVYVMIIMISSQFLFLQGSTDRALNFVTLAISIVFAYLLLGNTKKEEEAKLKIEKLAEDLEKTNNNLTEANTRQEGLIHFIGHEVKGYLAKSQAVFSSIADGDYGKVEDELKRIVGLAMKDSQEGVDTVMTMLNAVNTKKGTMKFDMAPFDLKGAVLKDVGDLRPNAEAKGLKLETEIKDGDYTMIGDQEQIAKHVIRNLIDNAIKYTQKGLVTVGLSMYGNKVLFSVKDTGVGITNEDKARLFTEGGRGKNSVKVNVHSTGYGLFYAKGITDAHNGRIWAESEGDGKGSTFFVEFPKK